MQSHARRQLLSWPWFQLPASLIYLQSRASNTCILLPQVTSLIFASFHYQFPRSAGLAAKMLPIAIQQTGRQHADDMRAFPLRETELVRVRCEDSPLAKHTKSDCISSLLLCSVSDRRPHPLLHLSLSPLSEVAADLMLLLMTFRRGNDMLAMYCKYLSLL